MTRGEHSDLEVVPQSENVDQQKYPYYSPEPVFATPHADDTHKIAYQPTVEENAHPQTICGLRKRTFWILAIIAIIVVVAAIGGGVGGALSSRSSKSNNTATQPQSSAASNGSTTPTPTSAEPSTSISTTRLVGPSSTILRDCPSSNNSIYTVSGSTTMQFRKACEISLININGIDNVFGRPFTSLDDCINACATYNINNRTRIAKGTDRICNAVCWRNTFDKINDWPGGMCFGFTTQNVTVQGASTWRFTSPAETRCDSAGLINQEF